METKLYLYKILSKQDWVESEQLGYIKPLDNDDTFIHLAEKQQITRIIAKYWANSNDILIAKIDPSKVSGRLVQEANPGGTNKYYHLYDGKILLSAVVEVFAYEKEQ